MAKAPINAKLARLEKNIGTVVRGKPEVIRLTLITLLAQGHLLLEDIPGVGKTTLAKAVAKSIDGNFQRIQFTPDLLPADVTGASIYNQETKEFQFHRGPIFANILLADEINRATPRTQSSLLQAMNEFQVSVDQSTIQLEHPFFVIATQNPIEFQGTFPLPEAQLDRFLMRLSIGYPQTSEEETILRNRQTSDPLDSIETIMGVGDVRALQDDAAKVHANDAILKYVVAISEATRNHEHVRLGVSPRGSLSLMKAAQANAFIEGRDFVTPDDVKAMVSPVYGHRLIMQQHHATQAQREKVLEEILETTRAPR